MYAESSSAKAARASKWGGKVNITHVAQLYKVYKLYSSMYW